MEKVLENTVRDRVPASKARCQTSPSGVLDGAMAEKAHSMSTDSTLLRGLKSDDVWLEASKNDVGV